MPEPRVASHILVSALRRKVESAGGFATIIARGDAVAGAILLICLPSHGSHAESPGKPVILEREPTLEGPGNWVAIGSQHTDNQDKFEDYLAKRRRADPDMWIVELDVADAERFAAEIIASA